METPQSIEIPEDIIEEECKSEKQWWRYADFEHTRLRVAADARIQDIGEWNHHNCARVFVSQSAITFDAKIREKPHLDRPILHLQEILHAAHQATFRAYNIFCLHCATFVRCFV